MVLFMSSSNDNDDSKTEGAALAFSCVKNCAVDIYSLNMAMRKEYLLIKYGNKVLVQRRRLLGHLDNHVPQGSIIGP